LLDEREALVLRKSLARLEQIHGGVPGCLIDAQLRVPPNRLSAVSIASAGRVAALCFGEASLASAVVSTGISVSSLFVHGRSFE
jgi:hypothetical protein